VAHPETKTLLSWANNYPGLRNAAGKHTRIDNGRTIAKGDSRILGPVGTPENAHGRL
jgi:hypothetical protein